MRYLSIFGLRLSKTGDVTLRPGVLLPGLGYLVSLGIAVGAVIVVVHPGPEHTLAARWGGGQILMTGAWILYKIGSHRIVLTPEVMRVVGFVLTWNVRRGGVQEVRSQAPYGIVIVLTDGSLIEPLMSLGRGGIGPSLNAMSRQKIMGWNAATPSDFVESDAGPLAWRQIRLNLLVLLGLSTVVAAEAITLTLANVW
jgi:hypothetical protein